MQDKHKFVTTQNVTKYDNIHLTKLTRRLMFKDIIVKHIDVVTHFACGKGAGNRKTFVS
jgi:hypothetical protein